AAAESRAGDRLGAPVPGQPPRPAERLLHPQEGHDSGTDLIEEYPPPVGPGAENVDAVVVAPNRVGGRLTGHPVTDLQVGELVPVQVTVQPQVERRYRDRWVTIVPAGTRCAQRGNRDGGDQRQRDRAVPAGPSARRFSGVVHRCRLPLRSVFAGRWRRRAAVVALPGGHLVDRRTVAAGTP